MPSDLSGPHKQARKQHECMWNGDQQGQECGNGDENRAGRSGDPHERCTA